MQAMEIYLLGEYDKAIEKASQAAKDPGSLAHLAGYLAHLAQGNKAPKPTGGYAFALQGLTKGQKVQQLDDYEECVTIVNALIALTNNDPDSAYIDVSTLLTRSEEDGACKLDNQGFLHYIRALALLQMNKHSMVKREMGLLQAVEGGSPLYSFLDALVYGTQRSFDTLKNKFGVTEQIRYLAELHAYEIK